MTIDKKKDASEDTVYWGNMWGWKLSYLGLALILILLGLMWMRKCQLDEGRAYDKTQIETDNE